MEGAGCSPAGIPWCKILAYPLPYQNKQTNKQANKHMLYLVALIQKPTKKEEEEGKQETLILEPTAVIARDDKSAAVQAVASNKDKINADLSNVEVIVRPF